VRSLESKNIAIISSGASGFLTPKTSKQNGSSEQKLTIFLKNHNYFGNFLIFGSVISNTLSTENYFIQNIQIVAQFATPSTLLPRKAVESS